MLRAIGLKTTPKSARCTSDDHNRTTYADQRHTYQIIRYPTLTRPSSYARRAFFIHPILTIRQSAEKLNANPKE